MPTARRSATIRPPAWRWLPIAAAAAAVLAVCLLPLWPSRPVNNPSHVENNASPSALPSVAVIPTSMQIPPTPATLPLTTNAPISTPAATVVAREEDIREDHRIVTIVSNIPSPVDLLASVPSTPEATPSTNIVALFVATNNAAEPTSIAPAIIVQKSPVPAITATGHPPETVVACAPEKQLDPLTLAVAAATTPTLGTIARIDGTLFLSQSTLAANNAGRHAGKIGEPIHAGDVLEVARSSAAVLQFPHPFNTARLYANTHITLTQEGLSQYFLLKSGRINLKGVLPPAAGSNLTVCTAQMEAQVVGTKHAEFFVTADAKLSACTVNAGQLQITFLGSKGGGLLLSSGQSISTDGNPPPPPPPRSGGSGGCPH